jgi:hypothetical protein
MVCQDIGTEQLKESGLFIYINYAVWNLLSGIENWFYYYKTSNGWGKENMPGSIAIEPRHVLCATLSDSTMLTNPKKQA